jgi:membrane protein DedA with SNARE-associated domain
MPGDQVLALIQVFGPVEVFLMMTANGFASTPPSEAVFAAAGALAAAGLIDGPTALAAGVVGNIIGTSGLYALGRWAGYEWLLSLNAWLVSRGRSGYTISRMFPGRELLCYFESLFSHRRGYLWVGVFRCFPLIRSVVSLPAGMVGMGVGPFLMFTSAGCSIWAGLWFSIGVVIGESWRLWSPTITGGLVSLLIIVVFVLKIRVKAALDRQVSRAPGDDHRKENL